MEKGAKSYQKHSRLVVQVPGQVFATHGTLHRRLSCCLSSPGILSRPSAMKSLQRECTSLEVLEPEITALNPREN